MEELRLKLCSDPKQNHERGGSSSPPILEHLTSLSSGPRELAQPAYIMEGKAGKRKLDEENKLSLLERDGERQACKIRFPERETILVRKQKYYCKNVTNMRSRGALHGSELLPCKHQSGV